MSCEKFEYQVGGSLSSDSPSYVYRQADHDFYEALKNGQFCYVLNSRQMGKSSLRVRAMQRLQLEGCFCIFVDLTGMGRLDLTPENWYAGFIQALVTGSNLNQTIEWRSWWKGRRDLLTPSQRLGLFIEEVLCPTLKKPVIIFVDEVDRVLSQSFPLDDFFDLIRCFSEKKVDDPNRYPLTFALLGVASPGELIRDRSKSPFNIGQAISLSGFTLQEAFPLMRGFQRLNQPSQILQEILIWTGGQPFLTQKVCQYISELAKVADSVCVESVVRSRLIDQWESQDEPEHFRTIRHRILRNSQTAVQCLGLYAEILHTGQLRSDHSPAQLNLRLSGLVVETQGVLQVHTRIYSEIFSMEWVLQQLSELRPYAEPLMAWCAVGQPPDRNLLSGQELEVALAWSADKQLSDLDYQYLVASQQQTHRFTQSILEETQQANQLLVKAQLTAEALARRHRLPWQWISLTVLPSLCALFGLSSLGLLQGSELMLYNFGLRSRPQSIMDSPVVLITLDETDIQNLGQWPISDEALARTVQTLQAKQVQMIGIDLYRDIPVSPGHATLRQTFASSPQVFGIEKLVGQMIAPPPTLPTSQVGFADHVLDPDGQVRRALLAMTIRGQLKFSFAAQMALSHLKKQGIVPVELDKDGRRVRLGQAIFERLSGNEGGYHQVDDGGYQILINWQKPAFDTLTLREVLAGKSPEGGWRDRIVLLGVTSEGTKDYFYTPLSRRRFAAPELTAGVSIHAQILCQIINAALGQQPLLKPVSPTWAWIWITGWAGLGAWVGGRASDWRLRLFCGSLGLLVWGGGWFVVLWGNFWLPGIHGLLAFLGTGCVAYGIARRQQVALKETHIPKLLQSDADLEAGCLALQMWKDLQLPKASSRDP